VRDRLKQLRNLRNQADYENDLSDDSDKMVSEAIVISEKILTAVPQN
jgi:hypothetical protein